MVIKQKQESLNDNLRPFSEYHREQHKWQLMSIQHCHRNTDISGKLADNMRMI
jgi:hypothetical protein